MQISSTQTPMPGIGGSGAVTSSPSAKVVLSAPFASKSSKKYGGSSRSNSGTTKEVSSFRPEPFASQKMVPVRGSGTGVVVGRGVGMGVEVGTGVVGVQEQIRKMVDKKKIGIRDFIPQPSEK